MSRSQSSNLLTWLLLGMIALICYGSLYPFNFKTAGTPETLAEAFKQLSWARAGRADRVSNILLYVPLGFCMLLWLRTKLRGQWAAAGVSTLFGTVLSLSIEVAQVYVSMRVPSLMDVTLNACGALIGALGGIAWRTLSTLVQLPSGGMQRSADRGAMVVLMLWLAWRLTPFAPQFDLTKLKSALQPLLHPGFSLTLTVRYLIFWLVVAQAMIALVSRPRSIEALLCLIVIVLTGRLLFVTPAFIPSELLGLLLLLPTLVVLHRLRFIPQSVAVTIAFAALFVIDRFAPFDFSAVQGSFDLWPFLPWIQAGMPIQTDALLQKLFIFAALAWLLNNAGLSSRMAAGAVSALVLLVELLKLWQPGMRGSITDPVLAYATGMVLHLVSVNTARRGRELRTTLR